MRHNSRLYTLCMALIATLTAQAQLRLVQPTANMGKLQWNVGKEATLEVENAGTTPANLVRIHTDCACVVAQFPTTPIAPGAKATVVLRHTAPLLGTFNRSIHLYTSDSNTPLKARLTGQVLSAVDNELYNFAHRIGDIGLTTNSVEFDDVSMGEQSQQVIHIQNTSEQTYEPQLMHLPPYLTATYEPARVFRGRTGKITLTLNTTLLNQLGLTQGSIYLSRFAGDHVGRDNEIGFSAVVHPPFKLLSKEEVAHAPNLELSTESLVLPMPKPKAKLKGQLLLHNSGESPLIIGNVQVFNPAINVRLKSTTILPGQTVPLDIIVVTKLITRTKQPLRLFIVTNDPTRTQRSVDIVIDKP